MTTSAHDDSPAHELMELLGDVKITLVPRGRSQRNNTKRFEDMEITVVDTEATLRAMLDDLTRQSWQRDWHLCVDFQGIELSRHGEVCTGQFLGKGSHQVYVVDFLAMDPFKLDPRLKRMLESRRILKLMFDPRNDADALGSLYNVQLERVLCLQVAQVAKRISMRRNGERVHAFNMVLRDVVKDETVRSLKDEGKKRYAQSPTSLKERPIDQALLQYSGLDVYYLDEMKVMMFDKCRSNKLKKETEEYSNRRLFEWKEPGFVATGEHKSFSPFAKMP